MNVSVIMPVYNESINEIEESINSILYQTYTHFEFIIIDDNPNSVKIKQYLLMKQNRDNRIVLIFNKKNSGVVQSVNKGIKYSSGKFIARMDADDVSMQNRLKKQLNFIKKNNLDLICSNFSDMNTKLKYFGSKDVIDQSYIKNIMSYCNIAMGPTLFFKKGILKKLISYRNILSEDYDLVARALIYNYNIGYQSSALIYKRNRVNNLSNNKGLYEFVISMIISCSLSNHEIKSLSYINYRINNIKQSDEYKFNEFKLYLNRYKYNKSFFDLLMMLKYNFSSFLVFKRNLWIVFINKKYKKYI